MGKVGKLMPKAPGTIGPVTAEEDDKEGAWFSMYIYLEYITSTLLLTMLFTD